jgi:hypothetical protein
MREDIQEIEQASAKTIKHVTWGKVESFFNSKVYGNLTKEDKIRLLSYVVEIKWNDENKGFIAEIRDYLIEKSSDPKILDGNLEIPFSDEDLRKLPELTITQIIQKIYDDTDIQREVKKNSLEKEKLHAEKKQSILLYKARKMLGWDSPEEQKKDLKKLQFVLLGWTHGDEKWALQGYQQAKESVQNKPIPWVSFYITNYEAVGKWTRESDEDINRPNSVWSSAWERKISLAQEIWTLDGSPYFIDFHNCYGKAKLGCVAEYNEKHTMMAQSLWLNAVIVFKDPELTNGALIDSLQKQKWWDAMIIEIWKEIDEGGKTSFQVASALLQLAEKISATQTKADIDIDDIKKMIDTESHTKPLEIEVSIVRDKGGKPIEVNDGSLPSEIQAAIKTEKIPDYCIQGKGNYFIKITKKDGDKIGYPTQEEYQNTIGSM